MMKQSDVFAIILVVSVGTLAAALLCNMILGDPDLLSVQYKAMDPVKAQLATPDPELFNPDSINPTVEVYVGECEDVDQNGIIDAAELAICNNTEYDPEDEGSEEQPAEE